jgi:hypothetical protein
VLGLQPDGELARCIFGWGTRLANWAGATGQAMEADTYNRIARNIPPWRPSDAGLPLGTVRLLSGLIDDKGLQVIALVCPSLPTTGPKGRPDDIDLVAGLGGYLWETQPVPRSPSPPEQVVGTVGVR